MKAKICLPGDRSVGINDGTVDIDFGEGPFDDQEWRNDLRKALTQVFQDYFDPCGKCFLLFEDECPDCGEQNCNDKCLPPEGR